MPVEPNILYSRGSFVDIEYWKWARAQACHQNCKKPKSLGATFLKQGYYLKAITKTSPTPILAIEVGFGANVNKAVHVKQ